MSPSLSPTSSAYCPSLLCSQLSTILICRSLSILLGLQTIQPIHFSPFFLPCFLFISLSFALLYVSIFLSQGDDWILPSSTLTLRKVTAMDEGQYTCMAEHPSMESLSKRRTISITVLPGKALDLPGQLTESTVALSLFLILKTGLGFLCNCWEIQLSTSPEQKQKTMCSVSFSVSQTSWVWVQLRHHEHYAEVLLCKTPGF